MRARRCRVALSHGLGPARSSARWRAVLLALAALTGCSGARATPVEAPAHDVVSEPEPTGDGTASSVGAAPDPAAPDVFTATPLPAIRLPVDVERAVDDAVLSAIARGELPGAVLAVGRRDGLVMLRAYGARALDPAREPNDVDTLYDLASLTKPIATATAVARLVERGALSWDSPVAPLVPGVDLRITVRHLLQHTSGLPAADPLAHYDGETRAQSIARIASLAPRTTPGERMLYSDLGFVLLGEVVGAAAGRPLDAVVEEEILAPLAMRSSGFMPDPSLLPRIAPTERAERRGNVMVRGSVHDPRAFRLGGVSGNAGLFASAPDVARFARMILGEGELEGARVLAPESVRALLGTDSGAALGWDRRTAEEARGRGMGEGSVGHLGWTGTAIRIDPTLDLFFVLLSNDVHPDGRGDIRPLAADLDRLIARAAPRLLAPPARDVRAGIDVALASDPGLAGARIVLLTHDAARTRDGRRTLDALAARTDLTLLRVLAPEHGLTVDHEGAVGGSRDPRTGLEVHSLFGRARRPDDAMLEGADTLVVDLVDVGARFYTYASTLHEALVAAATRPALRVVILDRPNPLGDAIEGPTLDPELRSFVNYHPLPIRHGLTMGELARMLDAELGLGLGARLVVVQAEGLTPPLDARTIGARWVPPSPNLPDLDAVALYPAVALLEGADVSVGRGTDAPFRVIGAPWMDEARVLASLRALDVPGVRFEATRFTPRSARHRGRACRGIAITLVDHPTYRASATGLALVRAVLEHHRDRLDLTRVLAMVGSRRALDAILEGREWGDLLALAHEDAAAFEARRAPFLLYR